MNPAITKTEVIAQPSRSGAVSPVTPVNAIADRAHATYEFLPGQQYHALVKTRLPNGEAQVLIAGQLLQMKLPDNIQPGNQIKLIFIAPQPHLSFLLKNEALSSSEKNQANISATGHLLGALIDNIMQSKPPKAMATMAPLLDNPEQNSAELPSLLQQALTQSGLFYESHLAQWITGRITLAQIKQEPQSKLTSAAMATATTSNTDTNVVNAQSLALVQQQLTALETGHLHWHGEIWPQQMLDWDIGDHSSDDEKETTKSNHQWQMQLHMTLPKLREVNAKIIFNGHDVHIKLAVSTKQTAQVLINNQTSLAAAIALAGLKMKAMEIYSDDNQ